METNQPNQHLRQSLLQSTGIDFEKYKTTELANSLGSLLDFPSKVGIYTTLMPLAWAGVGLTGAFLIGKFVSVLVGVSLGVLAISVLPITGFVVGAWLLSAKVTDDVEELFGASLKLLAQVGKDLPAAGANINPALLQKLSIGQILQGINSIVLLPLILDTIQNKIPLVGGRIGKWVSGMLQKSSQEADLISTEPTPNTQASGSFLTQYAKGLEVFSNKGLQNLNLFTKGARYAVVAPLKASAVIGLITTALTVGGLLLTLLF
jgi:hypothetical protein